ncbi:hypothetical protein F4802DRAFT_418631 [Xylaria palmicola]|nr:hypothetical protein F4802DRAFT_418631 [Xylaria palmicola]
MCAQDGAATSTSDAVTLVITTSPTPSAPSPDLIVDILGSFKLHCSVLLSCRVIVVFDTYDRIGECMRLKKGQITAEGAEAVELYKANVKDLILRTWYPGADHASRVFVQGSSLAEYGSPHLAENHVTLSTLQTDDGRVTFVEPAARLGFGLAVRSALRLTETPYVWVQQHDWPLARDIPLGPLVEVMRNSEGDSKAPVKYVCLPAIRMLSYATSAHVVRFPALRALTAALKRDFKAAPASSQSQSQPDCDRDRGVGVGVGVSVPLTPLFFWHDKPHVAATAHYLARVFPSRLAIARGDFIEDSIGQRARTQMKEGNWAKWACWLYYPGEGREVCLQHRHGRVWRGMAAEMQTRALFSEMKGKQNTPLPTP